MPAGKPASKRRSGCPLNASVEMLGDRWSLLILRDMMLRGFHSYKEFLTSYEGIATNILADRLRRLETYGIITTQPDPSDGPLGRQARRNRKPSACPANAKGQGAISGRHTKTLGGEDAFTPCCL